MDLSPPDSDELDEAGWGKRLLSSFHYREFRWYWTGSTLTHITFRIQEVVLGWQVLEATDSAFWVGAVAFAYGIPLFFLSPLAGLLADRLRRQWLVAGALALAAVASVAVSVLTETGRVQLWHLLLTSFVLGSCFALYAPARLALLPNLVPDASLLNAATLEYSTTRLMGFVGPVLAGLLMDWIGIPLTLLAQMVLFIGAALVFTRTGMDVGAPTTSDNAPRNILDGLRDVLTYLRNDPPLFALMALGVAIVPIGMTYSKVMQVFVRDVLGAGPTLLGLVLGLSGLGSAVSGFTLAALGNISRRGRTALLSSAAFGVGLILFSLTRQPATSLVVMFGVGLVSGVYLTLSNVIFQSEAPDALRGRVMSVWGMVWGLIPFTSLAVGALAEQWNVAGVIGLSGAICVLVSLVPLATRSKLLQL
jgi:MFS family permease